MRIIRGKHQRRQITAPSNLPVRPTTDMAKESLFNILENHVDFEDITVLDLFAGTGNISYELVSRGCPRVTAVDENNNCIKFIRETATKLNMEDLLLTILFFIALRALVKGFFGSKSTFTPDK